MLFRSAFGLLLVAGACCGCIREINWFQTLVWTISPKLAAKERPELEPTYAGASDELRASNPTISPTGLLSRPDVAVCGVVCPACGDHAADMFEAAWWPVDDESGWTSLPSRNATLSSNARVYLWKHISTISRHFYFLQSTHSF